MAAKKTTKQKAANKPKKHGELNALARRYFAKRQERLDLEAAAKKVKHVENELQDAMVAIMQKERMEKAAFPFGSISYKTVPVLKVHEWAEFYAWIKKTGNFECLEKRPHQAHIQEVLEEHPKLRKTGIPGSEFTDVFKVTARSK